MNTKIIVDNIKCSGCANTVQCKIGKIVTNVQVDESLGTVQFDYEDEGQLEEVKIALAKLGYVSEGQSTFKDKAKSYVSCFTGKIRSKSK